MKTQGILIAIEGLDGSGKSTLAKNLHQKLEAAGMQALLTREPGATPLGKILRSLIHEKNASMCHQAEYLLFAADRAQHFQDIVIPALNQGKIVLSDRMADSSLVYQGYGRGLSIPMIQSINNWVMQTIKPTITIYVKVPLHCALERIAQRQSHLATFEKEQQAFAQKLYEGFETIFVHRNDVLIIDGTPSAEQVAQIAYEQLMQKINT